MYELAAYKPMLVCMYVCECSMWVYLFVHMCLYVSVSALCLDGGIYWVECINVMGVYMYGRCV